MKVLISVRAANFVAAELKVTITERILWTDSQCVLHWLKTRKPLTVLSMGRRLNSLLPCTPEQLAPEVIDPKKVTEATRHVQERNKKYYDRSAKELPSTTQRCCQNSNGKMGSRNCKETS